MFEQITKFIKNLFTRFSGLKTGQKILIFFIGLAFIGLLIFSFSLSTEEGRVYLFKKPLTIEDYAKITSELDNLNIDYETLDEKYILVADEKVGVKVRTTLAQNNVLPTGIKGWELFDMESWTTTDFDRNVKLRRAIEGEIKRHLESLDWIESAEVSIAIPRRSLYTEREEDVTAAVTIKPREGYYENLKNKKLIQGIENIIQKGIDGLSSENITITDANGNDLNDFASDDYENNIKQAIAENKIKNGQIRKIKKKIEDALLGVYSEDRFKVAVDLEVNFDRKTIDQKEILPVVIKERTPGLPYDDSEIKDSVKVSSKKLNENFEGVGFIPEGPPGQEPNLPPGYKESLDGRNRYTKNEEIDNFLNGEKLVKQVDDATEIERKSISVNVDGIWRKKYDEDGNLIIKNDRIERDYFPVSEEDLRKLEDIIKGAINYNSRRDDIVVVQTIPFDREAQFLEEDRKIIRERRVYTVISVFLISFLVLFVGFILYRIVSRELAERRKRKENAEKMLRKMQLDKAIRDLETATVASGVTEEERDLLKLQDEINLAVKNEPVQAAKVVSSWINES